MSLETHCNICGKQLMRASEGYDFCDRCQPWGAEFIVEIQKVQTEILEYGKSKIDKFRAMFLNQKLSGQRNGLKAVVNDNSKIADRSV